MMNGGVKYRWDSNQGDSLTDLPAVSVLFLWHISNVRGNHAVQRAAPTLTEVMSEVTMQYREQYQH
jgi:hypothetical protein